MNALEQLGEAIARGFLRGLSGHTPAPSRRAYRPRRARVSGPAVAAAVADTPPSVDAEATEISGLPPEQLAAEVFRHVEPMVAAPVARPLPPQFDDDEEQRYLRACLAYGGGAHE